MKYKIEYSNSEDLFVIKTYGNMTGKGFIAMAKKILSHSDYKSGSNVLFDHRELNFKNVPIQDIEKIRDYHRENENKIGNGKLARVIKSQSEWDCLWERGKKIKTGNIVRIFEDFDSAINWVKQY